MLRFWWLPAIAIVILSVVPPSLRPVLGPHVLEHAAAFGLVAIWFGAAERRRRLWVLLAAAAAFACAVEFAQLFVHGRHANLRDLAIDVLAVLIGTVIGAMLRSAVASNA